MKNIINYILLFILLFIVIYQHCNPKVITKETITTDTITITDTIIEYKPVAKYITKTKTDTIYINDSVYIPIPMETKIYTDDSTYEASISGFKPSLDYIKVFPKETIITKEKVLEIKNKQRFSHSIQVGVGYGFFNKKPDVFVGYGISYNF